MWVSIVYSVFVIETKQIKTSSKVYNMKHIIRNEQAVMGVAALAFAQKSIVAICGERVSTKSVTLDLEDDCCPNCTLQAVSEIEEGSEDIFDNRSL